MLIIANFKTFIIEHKPYLTKKFWRAHINYVLNKFTVLMILLFYISCLQLGHAANSNKFDKGIMNWCYFSVKSVQWNEITLLYKYSL